ncbi:MAG TPA: DUF3445 domain-containing protein, partial [Thermomicrobiales bacterium]|nr:DUF3445 domain-containing protein [Thermomicrobiales bacterium]
MNFSTPLHELAWPFDGDEYRYSTNVHSAGSPVPTAAGSWGRSIVEIDAQYAEVIRYRADIVANDPARVQSLPGMSAATWDALVFVLRALADDYPGLMSLDLVDNRYVWKNRLLDVEQTFVFGDDRSLPANPLGFLISQIEEDAFVLTEREGHLHLDAFASTFAGSWSPVFDLGMTFSELHGPVPRLHGMGMIDRTERFLLSMKPGEIFRRTNWALHVD